jgi:hypothetical protein
MVVCFNFAEVCADACVAAGFEGVSDGEERIAVDDAAVCRQAVQIALYEAEGARTIYKKVGVA